MEPFCPLLLASFSFPLAKALAVNETTTAVSNWTSTTSGPPDPGAPQPLLALLLLPLLLCLLLLLLAAYFCRFRKQRKAAVSANDKKMPNGILEEQDLGGPEAKRGAACTRWRGPPTSQSWGRWASPALRLSGLGHQQQVS
ncbi:PREDICTED: receptor-type tyrosine-protein phosphatase epsilon-like [Hipposideros armiger]|uniref:Receptor-type tyrosine-protein phosphatase epsilon-like n=1 Tax=Hipposideros armiger TaxID=186990 RepID=A0A8B7RF01_HIPAR|nr:PREDICTED: receptor-type tyrosine-protein phosphatase epsilon-like [Hipposideros armiger]